ncbi:N/A [soil metagenome]
MATRSKHLERLAEIPLFATLNKRDLQSISKATSEITQPAGTVLMREGDTGREALVIVSGTVTVKRNGRKVASLGAGDAVGELSLLDHGPRTATVTADTDTTLLVLGARDFVELLEQVPNLNRKVLARLAGMVRDTDRRIYG